MLTLYLCIVLVYSTNLFDARWDITFIPLFQALCPLAQSHLVQRSREIRSDVIMSHQDRNLSNQVQLFRLRPC